VELALIENLVREQLDPVAEARGYQALIERGLNVRGIAQRLAKIPQKRVSERLAILKLPAELQVQIAEGTIPLHAVKPLTALARIHPELPAVAARRVLARPREQWDEPTTWADLADDPITVASADYEDEVGQPARRCPREWMQRSDRAVLAHGRQERTGRVEGEAALRASIASRPNGRRVHESAQSASNVNARP
jgi:ParB-like chromosome segregation protein Spo0J